MSRPEYTFGQFVIEIAVFFLTFIFLHDNYLEFPFIWRFLAAYGTGGAVGSLYLAGKILVEAIFDG